jgi:hypothetical protein
MSDNVIAFPGQNFGDLPAETVLTDALAANLAGVIVIGYDEHGMLYFTHSMPEPEDITWLLRCAERETFRALDL